jgi:hypothetical protein
MLSRRRLPLVYGILITSGFVGAWLTGLFDGDEIPAEISGLALLLRVVGFFIFAGSLIVFFYIVGRYRRPMNVAEAAAWKQVRENGKTSYMRLVLIRGCLMGLISTFLAVFYSGSSTGLSRFGIFMLVVSVIHICFLLCWHQILEIE